MDLPSQLNSEGKRNTESLRDAYYVSVVILYSDLAAALRAVNLVEEFTGRFNGKMQLRIKSMNLTTLDHSGTYSSALAEGTTSDMIIVSVNGLGELPSSLKKWLKDCLARRQEANLATLAVLGSHEDIDEANSHRLQFLKHSANLAGFDFFSPDDKQRSRQESSFFEETFFNGISEDSSNLLAS